MERYWKHFSELSTLSHINSIAKTEIKGVTIVKNPDVKLAQNLKK